MDNFELFNEKFSSLIGGDNKKLTTGPTKN